ncbi:MAG: hypothetical protein DKT66_14080 [Candidatus Melainabacteria bacterium]|nr:MAG: hypothetical protein DKT66_14080 [Candidatus Melainabacteria bacterium]
MTYLEKLPKTLIDDIRYGRCLPIVGSGFSRNAKVKEGRKAPPDWAGLASHLMIEGSTNGTKAVPHVCNQLEVISAFSERFGRVKLVEILHDLLWDGVSPGKVHDTFAKIPFDIVCTTNYDFLLEDAYRLQGVPYKPLLNETDLCMAIPKGYTSLLKMHGDLNHPDRLVLTEEDYDRFIDQNPLICTFLANQLMTKTPLFLGYSVDDANFRQIWQVIKTRLGKLSRRGYRIAVNDSDATISSFRRRGITVINLEDNNYELAYSGLFSELEKLVSEDARNNLSNLNIDLAAALKEDNNKIVVFAIPIRLLAFYKELVFPLLSKVGYVPVAFQELTAALGSFNANLYTLVDRCSAIIVDEEAEERFLVFGFGIRKLRENTVLMIRIPDSKRDDLPGTKFLNRPLNPYSGDAAETILFLTQFEEWLRALTPVEVHKPAASDLVVQFLGAWSKALGAIGSRYEPMPVSVMLRRAEHDKLITSDEMTELLRISRLRNSVAHSSEENLNPKPLSDALEFLIRLERKLSKEKK